MEASKKLLSDYEEEMLKYAHSLNDEKFTDIVIFVVRRMK
jgi:hypothetical protein